MIELNRAGFEHRLKTRFNLKQKKKDEKIMDLMTIILLAGGLGLFLFGMHIMSDGLEQAAGAKMRNILEFFTKNRFMGLMVGLIFTAIVQSSSATTVMVVSFVNSGLMNLYQAAGVILGANIGTTVTGQLISLDLSEIAPLFVIVGVIMYMFCKREGIKKAGYVLLGFGILFMGLSTMSDAMATVKESPEIVSILTSMKNPLAAILVGFVITAILQSSSATVGIVILLANQGLLNISICFFLIMGCNMGSCVSALLASLNGKKDAKRAAWIHFLVNVIGTTILSIVLFILLEPASQFFMEFSGGNAGRAVANAHTSIKIAEVILTFPIITWIVKLTYMVVPGQDEAPVNKFELKYINSKNVISTETAVLDAILELNHMGELALENVKLSIEALCTGESKKIERVYRNEAHIDYLSSTIIDYIVKVSGMHLSPEDAQKVSSLFYVANDIERIGDHAENFADYAKYISKSNAKLSETAVTQLNEMAANVERQLECALEMFSTQSIEHAVEVRKLEYKVDDMKDELQESHIKRLTEQKCTPQVGMVFCDTVSGLERIADHATNIAFALLNVNKKDIIIDEE